jgi:hypothetical protein
MQQASILFTFAVLCMGAAWIALMEFGGSEAQAAEPAAIVSDASQPL